MFLVSFQGVYGIGHIVYLIISILLMVLGIIIIKLVKKEDIYFRIIKISGIRVKMKQELFIAIGAKFYIVWL